MPSLPNERSSGRRLGSHMLCSSAAYSPFRTTADAAVALQQTASTHSLCSLASPSSLLFACRRWNGAWNPGQQRAGRRRPSMSAPSIHRPQALTCVGTAVCLSVCGHRRSCSSTRPRPSCQVRHIQSLADATASSRWWRPPLRHALELSISEQQSRRTLASSFADD